MELTIKFKKIKDRIKEQELAEKRGWTYGSYGYDGKYYYVVYSKKIKRRKRTINNRKTLK